MLDEALIIQNRFQHREAAKSVMLQAAVASVISKKGAKHFKQVIERAMED